MPKCAVIILNWNGARLLRQYLPSVVANTDPALATVIVADNGSTDESLTVLRDEFQSVTVWPFDTNHGFAGGYNLCLQRAAKEGYTYTVLLNSDVETPAGWLEPMLSYMESHPDVGACQPKLLSYSDREMFEYAGASGGFIDRNGYPYCRGRVFSVCERDNGQYDDVIDIFWATGACLLVRTELYLQVGGLDELFFAHMEEIDLCWRIQLAGYSLRVVPQSVAYHLGGGSLPAGNPRKTYLNFRNNLLLLHKNLPDSTRGRTLLWRRLLDTVAWAKFALTLDLKNAGAVWRAHRDFARMRKQYTTHPDRDLLHTSPRRPNILTAFYLLGRKTYNRL